MKIRHLFISPAHIYVGHFGGPAGDSPISAVDEIECIAGRGIRGDRYFDHKPDYKGQVTFFEWETHENLSAHLGIYDKGPETYRRNVIVSGVSLSSLIGQEFTVQGVRFRGSEEASPCFWMNRAFGSGAEEALRGRGGLRARILSDGFLRREP
jgi:MOSC domain-containing protein YiiM